MDIDCCIGGYYMKELEELKTLLNKKLKKENKKILKLSPRVINADYIDEYLSRIDACIKDKDVLNIAITGNYGTGKSSIIKTYIEKYNLEDDEYIQINLANFIKQMNNKEKETGDSQIPTPESIIADEEQEDKKEEDIQENYKLSSEELKIEETIEDAIVRQLLFRNNNYSNYESNFKTASSNNKRLANIFVTFYTIFCIVAYYAYQCLLKDNSKIFFEFVNNNKLLEKITSHILENYSDIIYYVLPLFIFIFILGIIYIIYNFSISLLHSLRSISFKIEGSTINLNPDKELSFAKNLREIILYFTAHKKLKIVIFEDLDRYPKDIVLKLMEELRKLNGQLFNSSVVKQKVSFIYTFKEDIFEKIEDKNKFYDYIISAMPISSFYNSDSNIEELLNKIEKKNKISDDLIEILSKYVYDYRTLTSIVNDYDLFSDIQKINDDNKIFAICILKNCYIKEYGKILEHDNFIELEFKKIYEKIKEINNDLDEKIKEQNHKIDVIKDENQRNIEQLKILFWEKGHNKRSRPSYLRKKSTDKVYYYDEYLQNFDFNELKTSEFNFDDGYAINYDIFGGKEQFFEQLEPKSVRIAKCEEIIESYNNQKINFSDINLKTYHEYFDNKDIDLLEELIVTKFVGRDYMDYITSPSADGLTGSENKFIFEVKHNRYSMFTPIKNYKKVTEKLTNYFGEPYILNIDLVKNIFIDSTYIEHKVYILNQFLKLTAYKIEFIYWLYQNERNTFINIMTYICDNKVDIWEFVKNEDDLIKNVIFEGLIQCKNWMESVNDKENFIEYMNEKLNDIRYINTLNNVSILKNIAENVGNKLRLKNVYRTISYIRTIIEENGMFEFNKDNIDIIYGIYFDKLEQYKNLPYIEERLIRHIKNNFEKFYNELYINNTKVLLGEEISKEVLLQELPLEMKKEIYRRETFKVNIEEINNPELYLDAIEYNHIESNWNNILKLDTKELRNKVFELVKENIHKLLTEEELKNHKEEIVKHQLLLDKIKYFLIEIENYDLLYMIAPLCRFKVDSIYNLTNKQIKELNRINLLDFNINKLARLKSINEEEIRIFFEHWVDRTEYNDLYNKIKNREDSKMLVQEILKLNNVYLIDKFDIVMKYTQNITVAKECFDCFLIPGKTYEIKYTQTRYYKIRNHYLDLFVECRRVDKNIVLTYK